MYLDWAYQLYNVVFTALPIIIFGVFERDFNPQILKNNPHLYKLTQHKQLFNMKVFFTYVLDAIYESCILTLVPFYIYSNCTSDNDSGQTTGIWTFGIVALTSIVFTANLRLAFITTNWTFWMHFVTWGSIIAYFIVMIILNSSTVFATAGADYYLLVYRLMGTYKFWLTVFLVTILALFIPFSTYAFITLRSKNNQDFYLNPVITYQTNDQKNKDDDKNKN